MKLIHTIFHQYDLVRRILLGPVRSRVVLYGSRRRRGRRHWIYFGKQKGQRSGREDREGQRERRRCSERVKRGLWQVSWEKRRYMIFRPACNDLSRTFLRARSQGRRLKRWHTQEWQLARTQLWVSPRVILQPHRTLILLVSCTSILASRYSHDLRRAENFFFMGDGKKNCRLWTGFNFGNASC